MAKNVIVTTGSYNGNRVQVVLPWVDLKNWRMPDGTIWRRTMQKDAVDDVALLCVSAVALGGKGRDRVFGLVHHHLGQHGYTLVSSRDLTVTYDPLNHGFEYFRSEKTNG